MTASPTHPERRPGARGFPRRRPAWSLACTVPGVFLVAWVFVPRGPADGLTLLLAEGWSLWPALWCLLGLALVRRELRARRSGAVASLVAGVLGVSLGVTPLVVGWRLAMRHGASMDVGRAVVAPLDGTVDAVADARPSNRGAVVVVPGASFDAGASITEWLVTQGFRVVIAEHGRVLPAAVLDVKCAVAKAQDEFGEVTLLGYGMGAHLALMAAYTTGHPEFPMRCQRHDRSVRQVIGLYGPTDLAWSFTHDAGVAAEELRRRLGGTPSEVPDAYRDFSPMTHLTGGAPRTLLIHGGNDVLVHPFHMRFLQWQADAVGVELRTLELPYSAHAFDRVVGGRGWQLATAAILEFDDGRWPPPRRRGRAW